MMSQKALLDSLMGADRNLGNKDPKRQNFWDDDVCKNHLVWECPHSMFSNQAGKISMKSPLGECPKQHSEAMKIRLQEDRDYAKYRLKYLKDTRKILQKLVGEVDKKKERDRENLKKGDSITKDTQEFVMKQIAKRSNDLNQRLEEADKKAAMGEMEVSHDVFEEALYLTEEQQRLSALKENAELWSDELCETCGAYISWREPEAVRHKKEGRPHPHYMGAVCTGYKRIRESLGKLDKELQKLDPDGGHGNDNKGDEHDSGEEGEGRADRSAGRERRRESDRGRRLDNEASRDSAGGSRDHERRRDRERDYRGEERSRYGSGRREGDWDFDRQGRHDRRGDRGRSNRQSYRDYGDSGAEGETRRDRDGSRDLRRRDRSRSYRR